MRKIYVTGFLITVVAVLSMCNKADSFSEAGYDERLSGGMATAFNESSKAFSQAIAGLSDRDAFIHELGDAAFEQTFVSAPAPVNSGLGPVFNNVSCISCHHNDGKGTPTAGFVNSSMLFRLSTIGVDEHGAPLTVTGYGNQIQDVAVFGRRSEASIGISYTDRQVVYPDGLIVTLRNPTYTISNEYMPIPAGHLLSPRMAPPVFGLGLLQTIPESTILSFADENDADGDGISGKPNYVWNPYTQQRELGRFGLKANTSSLKVQVASAYNQDMGVTNYIFPVESTFGQSQADGLTDDPELADSLLNAVEFYIRTLAVPARRATTNVDVIAGKQLFMQIKCGSCHKPLIQTGTDLTLRALNNQRIQPYSDLLLHDMGPALADGRPDFLASGSEWRTAPLWGIGLFPRTNGIPFYLHDGRARTIEEAILWHGGEAEAAKTKFMQLSSAERLQVLKFLQSL